MDTIWLQSRLVYLDVIWPQYGFDMDSIWYQHGFDKDSICGFNMDLTFSESISPCIPNHFGLIYGLIMVVGIGSEIIWRNNSFVPDFR